VYLRVSVQLVIHVFHAVLTESPIDENPAITGLDSPFDNDNNNQDPFAVPIFKHGNSNEIP